MNSSELFREINETDPQRHLVAWSLAQLDDQLSRLKARLRGINLDELCWQVSRGTNTIGMLLAHLAVTEAYWLNVAPLEETATENEDRIVRSVVGIRINDDGIPLPPNGGHPATLYSKSWEDYLEMIEKARARTHQVTAAWTDATLTSTFKREGQIISYAWVLYHLLEHFCSHFGQILQIRALWHRIQCG
jgi:uncharacterized damage-inducible protein DinB